MFYLTSYIIITLQDGRRLRVRPYSVKWKRSVENLCDTCEITLPLHPYLYTTGPNQSSRECLIRVDDPVSVSLGYNDNNTVRFIGFVASVNYSERLVLQCEGYYHLIKRGNKDKSWKSVNLKELLEYLTSGTDITLSKSIPDEQLGTVSLQNASMDKVFEMLKNNYQCVAYFKGSELYCGPSYFPDRTATQVKKLRIGWNVKSGEVKNQPLAEVVNIVLKTTNDKGKTTKTKPSGTEVKADNKKEYKIKDTLSESYRKELKKRLQNEANAKSLKQADVTCFLEPQLELGEVVEVIDQRYPERNGRFFVAAIDGEFGESGGSQKLTLKYYGD